jgi:serine/threonine protein kinase
VGQTLDEKYRLDEPLGQGGMGTVYKATHLGTDRVVAVKVIAQRYGDQPEFVERFRREARAAGRLRHPNVVDVTDFGFAGVDGHRLAYLVMEYLDGTSLADVLEDEGRLSLEWVVEILDPVCSAVQEAHEQGIVHRDLKPDNLWLESDRRGGYTVKVLDFGLAKLAEPDGPVAPPPATVAANGPPAVPAEGTEEASDDEETRVRETPSPRTTHPGGGELTRAGDVLGTPVYMSPEQCRGDALDARSDVYSLGVLAYRMLAGHPPFRGDAATVIHLHMSQPPPPLPSPPGRRLPPAVVELIMSALDKDPARRPASAAAFAAALRARAERRLSLLRSLQAILADRSGVLVRISLLAHAPLLLASIAVVAIEWSVARAHPALAHALAKLAFVPGWTLALLANAAMSEPVVMQTLVAPRRPPQLGTLLKGLRGRLWPFARTIAPFMLAVTIPLLIWLLPFAWAWNVAAVACGLGFLWLALRLDTFWFVSEAVIVEGLEGRAARQRSRELSRRSRRLLPKMQGLGYAGFLLVVILATLARALARIAWERLTPPGTPGGWGLAGVVAVPLIAPFVPLVSVPFALLYFRTREAAGEPLAQILSEFERRVLPPSSWQMRLRDRLRSEIRSRR